MRKQYNFWPGPVGLDAWDVDRLIELSRDLPVRHDRGVVDLGARHGLLVTDAGPHGATGRRARPAGPTSTRPTRFLAAAVGHGRHAPRGSGTDHGRSTSPRSLEVQPEPDFRDCVRGPALSVRSRSRQGRRRCRLEASGSRGVDRLVRRHPVRWRPGTRGSCRSAERLVGNRSRVDRTALPRRRCRSRRSRPPVSAVGSAGVEEVALGGGSGGGGWSWPVAGEEGEPGRVGAGWHRWSLGGPVPPGGLSSGGMSRRFPLGSRGPKV